MVHEKRAGGMGEREGTWVMGIAGPIKVRLSYLKVQVVEDGRRPRPRPNVALRGDRAKDKCLC